MVLMSAVENDRHHRVANHSSADIQAPAQPPSRARLHGFSFPTLSWGTHRLLRCAKTGPASAPAPAAPETLSPEKEKPHRPEGGGGGSSLAQRHQRAAAAAAQRPWNLRTRRAATAAPSPQPRPRPAGGSGDADEEEAAAAERAPASAAEGKKRRGGLSIALSKQEIAEDFAAIRGTRPPRRPKKRPRAVQRQLDSLYAGLCLADVTPGSYKIEEM